MPLLNFLHSNREIVLSQNIQQVVSNAGDGNLRDANSASAEFRQFLTHVPIESLFAYVAQCLDSPFVRSGSVLQDLVNELGRRLDFHVENGLYQGRRNAIGFDGIWKFSGEPELIIEVKTTDAYSFALEVTNSYREHLLAEKRIGRAASILIVVGREDTGALEEQIRGSRFAWDIHLISVESLIKLVKIRAKSEDPATVRQIHQLLRPFEYTKIDKIIDILFTTATDVESQQDEEQLEVSVSEAELQNTDIPFHERTHHALIEERKTRAIAGFSTNKGVEMVRRSRSYFWSSDKQLLAVCTVSKRYESNYQHYWYAYHPKWDEFLVMGEGYLILGCMDLDSAFAIPRQWLLENLSHLNATQRPGGQHYWHIPLTTLLDGGYAISLTKVGRKFPLEPYRFPLPPIVHRENQARSAASAG